MRLKTVRWAERFGSAAPVQAGYAMAIGQRPPSVYRDKETKNDHTSLLPGGMALDARTGFLRFVPAGSPEPAVGFGATKGIDASYHGAIPVPGTLPVMR